MSIFGHISGIKTTGLKNICAQRGSKTTLYHHCHYHHHTHTRTPVCWIDVWLSCKSTSTKRGYLCELEGSEDWEVGVAVSGPELSPDKASSLFFSAPLYVEVRQGHGSALGIEGKTLARDFIVRLIKSGVRPSISGDLWSENGMGLFGIYAHGITETFEMEKYLIALIACDSERHTAQNIKRWTVEALEGIGLTAKDLAGP